MYQEIIDRIKEAIYYSKHGTSDIWAAALEYYKVKYPSEYKEATKLAK